MNNKTDKRPIFKRVWFWVIVAILVIGVGIAVGSKDDEPQKIGGSSTQISDSDNKEFAVNDIISVDGQEISVTSVERNYTPDSEFVEASAGKEYVKVNLQIQNKSKDATSFNALDWEIESSDGVINNYLNAMLAQADDNLSSGNLAANGTKKGSIVFEVPASDTKLKLHFKPSFWSNKEVVINL